MWRGGWGDGGSLELFSGRVRCGGGGECCSSEVLLGMDGLRCWGGVARGELLGSLGECCFYSRGCSFLGVGECVGGRGGVAFSVGWRLYSSGVGVGRCLFVGVFSLAGSGLGEQV